jgi:hypothetical protein
MAQMKQAEAASSARSVDKKNRTAILCLMTSSKQV